MVIVLVGNLSDGFRAHGPYKDFDVAAANHTGVDVWIMSLEGPVARPECLLCNIDHRKDCPNHYNNRQRKAKRLK